MLDVYLETVKASGKEAIAQFEASTVANSWSKWEVCGGGLAGDPGHRV